MRASATHSLLSPEHRPERVPLVRTFPDEIFEPIDHALHHVFFALALAQGERRVELDAKVTWRRRELVCGHQCRSGLERQRGGATRHDRATAEEPHLHARSLLEVAEEGDDAVVAERFG